MLVLLVFPITSEAQTANENLKDGNKLSEEEAIQLPFTQFKELQEKGLIDQEVKYPESDNPTDWNSINLEDYGLYEQENGELSSLPEGENNIMPMTYSTRYPGSSVNVRIGDILVTSSTRSNGLTGHVGIVISQDRVVHIEGQDQTVSRKGISNWFNDYPTTTVVRMKSLSQAQTAGNWAYNYERDYSHATYSIKTTLKSGSNRAQQIAGGDLTAEPIHLKNKDEIGELAHSFNVMLVNLREMIAQVSLTSKKVAVSSEELSATSEQSAQVSETIAQAIQQVAVGAENQSRNALHSSDLIRNVTAGVRQVTVNAQSVANASVETTYKAKDGAVIMDSSIVEIETVNENIQDVAGRIKHLGVRSKEIGQIVGVITQIAEQTNLLALNAAIEAARAGEHGRGFAVVADEVRKLAEQSKESSEQIKHLVTTILTETEQTVMSMDGTVEQSSKGIAAIKSVEQTFEDIQCAVNDVTLQIQELSTATEQMAGSMEQIASSVDEITSITTETASQTQQVSVSMEEQSASSGEITASATSLAKLAEELQQSVQKFKI